MQKKIFFVLVFLCLKLSYCYAQMSPVDMESKLKLVYAPLNVSPVQKSTGIFMDVIPQYLATANFRGIYPKKLVIIENGKVIHRDKIIKI